MNNIFKSICKLLLTLIFIVTSSIAVQAQVSKRIHYLEVPTRYEGKRSTSFKVFQSLEGGALAHEVSDKLMGFYYGKVVLILGNNFYEGQIIKIKKPTQVGIYKYENKEGDIKTVPAVM